MQDIRQHAVQQQIPRSSRRNPLPVKRINGSLLMRHEHATRALVELMQIGKTSSGADRVLHDTPEAFDSIEVMATMGRQEMEAKLPAISRSRDVRGGIR